MARLSYLLRRGASYYARIRVPNDLVEIVGKNELVKALGTKDEQTAKRALWPVVEEWNRQFDDLRARRDITADDKAVATWQHYEATLKRDDQRRNALPTSGDIEAEKAKIMERAKAGEIPDTDPLTIFDATLDLEVLKNARQFEEQTRRTKLDALQKHLAEGETALVAAHVDAYAEDNRLLMDARDPDWKDTAQRMIRAEIEGLKRTLERDKGDYSGAPADPIVKPATNTAREAAAPGESIMELFELYAAENPKQITTDTLNQARRDIGNFLEHVGSTCPAHRIDKKAVREWKALLMKYPVKATETKAFAGMKLSQIVKHNETVKKPVLTPRTVNRYLASLGAFCNWLVNNGYLDVNPVDGMSLAKDKKKKVFPFTTEQMNTLFASPLFTGCQSDEAPRFWSKPGSVLIRDHRYWVPLVMLYSGARPAEIAQLLVSDVRQDHGHWIMEITETDDGEETGKSVKNVGSRRVVPIHSELVRLGFIKYHASMKNAGQTRLFPKAERNERGQMIADFSREFGRYLTRIGLKIGRGISLYSFRHGAFDAMRRAGYLDEQFGYIFGHQTGNKVTRGYGVLPQGILEQRVELVEAISYADLDLSAISPK
ncbi:site-specific integrase [Agrobacterium tumefaciens]|uniref:site-specific integrase n=1 Tax=Agrobacterium tumefaciens TaxID=358 RepID=UPI001573AD8D|nr:site-specific integrase [Agrobacterium tumefaciens]NSZ01956.1 site-specific integrase [Agrobacterium tumefaciens]NSZ38657.1 site-specific integrase [Agrobacterium tumefaciens]NTB23480.1 site-specific integrase [Agrobacterium tumefaciens]NTB29569.1 site-specific integrase [Agrobacterium tumefaciens]NTB32514.1 site-specific integrase [Agrobacterium tumefaciens]